MSIAITIKRHHWSRRIRLTVRADGTVLVTMPRRGSLRMVERFIEEKRAWIEERVKRVKLREIENVVRTSKVIPTKDARALIEPLVERYCELFGVVCKRISIRNQRSRWGSCSSKKTLSFNACLALVPLELAEYVVVHEVCHLLEMNHSPKFWSLVAMALPDFQRRRAALKRIDRT